MLVFKTQLCITEDDLPYKVSPLCFIFNQEKKLKFNIGHSSQMFLFQRFSQSRIWTY